MYKRNPSIDRAYLGLFSYLKAGSSCKGIKRGWYSNGQICVIRWAGYRGLYAFCLSFSPFLPWVSGTRERKKVFFFNNFHKKKKKNGICSQNYRRSRIERKKLFPGVLSVLCRGRFSTPWDSRKALLFSKYTLPSVGKVVHFCSADKNDLRINCSANVGFLSKIQRPIPPNQKKRKK